MAESGEWFVVVRVYRNRRRVLAIEANRSDAETAYKVAVANLRDGDVVLARANLETIFVQSGGYNRTRW